MASRVERVAVTGSTNADLLARLANGEEIAEGTWLIADRQVAGRGRRGRSWLDAPGNFMGSTVVTLQPGDAGAATLSFVAALAVYEAVLPHVSQPQALQLKWPNDVLYAGAKFCGLLLERSGNHAVIGVGVNLVTAPAIGGRRTATLGLAGPARSRDDFAQDLVRCFASELSRWRELGAPPLFDRWLSAAHPVGQALTVHDGAGNLLAGTFKGLEADGALRLRLADGTVRVVHAGDVTLGEG